MGVLRGHPATAQDLDAVGIGVDIDGVTSVTAQVTTLDQYPTCTQIPQALRLVAQLTEDRRGLLPQQDGRLIEVRSDEIGFGAQTAHGTDRLLVEKAVPGGGHHDRVEHRMSESRQVLPHRVGQLGGGEHPDLCGIGDDVLQQRVHLETDEVDRHGVHTGHTAR